MQPVEVTVYYLEMLEPVPTDLTTPRSGLMVVHRPMPQIESYRELYKAVGEDYRWLSRRKLTDEELSAIIHNPLTEVHILQVDGVDAGFAELDCHDPEQLEIVQFGLLPAFIGQGLGKWFLKQVTDDCWSRGPNRVWLHTCTFDHPAALPNYLQAGFKLYKTEVIQREY